MGKNCVYKRTSEVIVRISSHMRRGRMFLRKGRLISVSTISSSASRGWSGKEVGDVLQDFMAQVRKLRVRSFIFFPSALVIFLIEEFRSQRARELGLEGRGSRTVDKRPFCARKIWWEILGRSEGDGGEWHKFWETAGGVKGS